MSNATIASNNNIYEFQAGVTACLRLWSVLKTCLDNGWGTLPKAEEIRTMIYTSMDGTSVRPKKPFMDRIDLEDYLAIYMEEEFSLVLEDESEQQIATTLFTLYEQCCFQNNISLAKQLIYNEYLQQQQQNNGSSNGGNIIQSPDDDDDDDDVMDTGGDDDNELVNMDDDNNDFTNNSNANDPNNGMMQASLYQQQPVVASATTAASLTVPSMDDFFRSFSYPEYAREPLFGNTCNQNINKPLPVVRQLGQDPVAPVITMKPEIQVDEDGFAPILTKKQLRQLQQQQQQQQG